MLGEYESVYESLRGQAGRNPSLRFARMLRKQGFLPTRHFVERFLERVLSTGQRFDPRTFRSEFFRAHHYKQSRPGYRTRFAVVGRVPIIYRPGGWSGRQIVLVTVYPKDKKMPPVVRARSPEREAEVDGRGREYVRWVQVSLNRIMRAGLRVDGIPGPRTRRAIAAFQRRRRLRPDGIVGPVTERALRAAGAPPPPISAVLPPGRPSALRQNIVQVARGELQRWGNGRKKENDPRMRSMLETYWRTGAGWLPRQANWWSSVPWSAAFISYIMRRAGAGRNFRYSGGHSYYIVAAKNNRLANNANPFKAYRTSEAIPRPGDIVCKSRAGSGATYDSIRGGMSTHCDIVTEVRPGKLITVGGNVSNSVKVTEVPIDSAGRIAKPGYFAVIKVGS